MSTPTVEVIQAATVVEVVEQVIVIEVQGADAEDVEPEPVETIVVEVRVPGPPGPPGDDGEDGEDGEDGADGESGARARFHVSVASGTDTISYLGVAPVGSLTSQAVWTLRRKTFNAAGALTASATATASPNAIADDYLTEPYA